MCGICGVIGRVPDGTVERMTGALYHRGPDSDGFYHDEYAHLGMRRLKIIDLGGSEQPVTNEDGSVILICNGEIYNYKSLRARLEDRGHVFSTRGDVETIVHLYEEYGEDCVRHLDGMFAFAVWDRRTNRLLIARDRLGIKPLYWTKLPGKFVFGSELRAVVASREIDPVLDEASVIDYVSFPAVPAPMTMFRQIQMLLPGHRLSLTADRVTLEEYWDVDFVKASQSPIPENECIETVRHVLSEAVSKRMMSDVPLGAFLSGGIDSSAIVGLMGTMLDLPVKTFSIRFTGDDPSYTWYDDASFAVKIAQAFGTDHTEKVVTGEDIVKQLLRAVWAMDQPSGDALQYYILSQCASEEVTVVLSGTGGDEVFAGYEWFKEIRRLEGIHRKFKRLTPAMARAIELQLRRFPRGYEMSPWRRRLRNFLAGRRDFATRYRLNRRLYFGDDYYYLFSPDFIARTVDFSNQILDRIDIYSDRCEGLDPVDRMSYIQLKSDMVDLLVRDQDAMSMAHSLELRLPMIDSALVETAARIPASMKLHGNREKHVLRMAVQDLLPGEIINRRKKGFIFPMGDWMRYSLKPVVDSCLSAESVKRRGIFNPDTVQGLTRDFFEGRQPFFKIWNLAVFELWCRIVLDRSDGWSEPPGNLEDYLDEPAADTH